MISNHNMHPKSVYTARLTIYITYLSEVVEIKEGTSGLTIRIPDDLLHTLRFIAAHKESSMNTLIVEALRQLVATTRVELPSDLLLAGEAPEKES